MAKIKYSALVSDIRNKLNGSVMSKNRYGSYMRNKVTPVNPQTSFQQNQRARLSSVSQSWKGLSSAVRSAFADLANNHPLTNIFGDQVKLDGKAFFSRLSLNRLSAGLTILTEALPLQGVPFVSILEGEFVPDAEVLSMTISAATVPAGYTAVVQATRVLPNTINFMKNEYRELGTITAAAGVVDLYPLYSARFGSTAGISEPGVKVGIRLFLVDNATGEAGLPTNIVLVNA